MSTVSPASLLAAQSSSRGSTDGAGNGSLPLTVLSDNEVMALLEELTLEDVLNMQQALRTSLHEYSTAKQDNPACQKNQQERMVIEHRNGTTTLIMPAQSSAGMSLKVVTLAAPSGIVIDDDEEVEESTGGVKACPQGSLTLMTPDGKAFGFVNAEELTAYRTALASSLLMSRRSKIKTVTIFGSGKQAYWHLRLALMIHGESIHNVHIHVHRFTVATKEFFKNFVGFDSDIKAREGWSNARFDVKTVGHYEYQRMAKVDVRNADMIICATPSEKPLFDETYLTNPAGRLKGRLIIAIGSFKPSMIELPPAILRQAVKHHGAGIHIRKRAREGSCVLVDTTKALKQTGELIQAELKENHVVEIGEIVMLDEQFAQEQDDDDSAIDDSELRSSMDASTSNSSFSMSDGKSSMASVMSDIGNQGRDSSRRSSRTLSRSSSFSDSHSVLAFLKRHHDLNDHHTKKQSKDEKEMTEWLCKGNVIYKSVGIGLMDLVVGMELVKLARRQRAGTVVKHF